MTEEQRQNALGALHRMYDCTPRNSNGAPRDYVARDFIIIRAALKSTTISETQLESEIKKPTMSETQNGD